MTNLGTRIKVGDFKVTPRMRELVNQVLSTERISHGPLSRQFEREFANLHGCLYGTLSNSGTSSLHVALQALKEIHNWPSDTEVIVPALTFVATVNVVLHNNLTPVFVDVDPRTYNIDTSLIEAAITDKTRCIIPVNLFGQAANMNEITSIAVGHDLNILEDSCEAMFCTHEGEPVGSWGDIACFSMYVAHFLTAGVGGIATTSNPEYAAKMRSLVNHGRDGIYMDIDVPSAPEVIKRRFSFNSVGHSFRITELEAALALAQLEDWEAMIHKRRFNATALTIMLGKHEKFLQLPIIADGNSHSFMMFAIVCKGGVDKARLTEYLETKGIETRDMLPLTNQPIYANIIDRSKYPVAEWINDNGFYIGCHDSITKDDLVYVAETFDSYFSEEHNG